jgi:YegS/Rv2252/BmrU family lipid kinase
MPAQVLLILSKAKAETLGARLARVVDALGGRGRVTVERVDSPDEIPPRIVEVSGSVDLVALGGGDGTMATAARALMQTGLPLLVIPLGTANDLARTLGLPRDPVAAAGLLGTGRREDVDVGEVETDRGRRCFYNAAGVGLSVDVAERLSRGSKRFGPYSYLIAMLDILKARRSFRARVCVDGETVVLRSIQVTVGNGVRHGGGVRVRRDASIDDGTLDLYSLEPLPLWRLIRLLPAFLKGTHDAWRSVTTLRGREITLDTPAKPKRINADGEIVGRTPARFRLHRNAVVVVVPAGLDTRRPA